MFKRNQLTTAVYLTTLSVPITAVAETAIEEITVTATRRATSIQDVPYNISAYGGSELSDAGINDFSKIARSIPGLTLSDAGRSKNGINNGIVIRGLNITGSQQEEFPSLTDPVVSVYLGETPLFANLELRDLDRVEVLRGPQATLYGSGSLGGTLKYLPAEPDFDSVYGNVKSKLSVTDESDDFNTDFEATLNLPLSEKLALRATVADLSNAGYIDSDFIEVLDDNDQPTGELNPQDDINDEDVQMFRVSLKYLPTESTDILLTYNYQKDDIAGSSATATGLDGYESGTKILEEFERDISLGSLVIKQDLGFAELTSATSITENESEGVQDQSYNYGFSSFWSFYAGVPREVVTGLKNYDSKSTTQEFRLASTADSNLTWLAGLYYNDVDFDAEAFDIIAGIDEFFGITNPQFQDLAYSNLLNTEFEDNAIFGELTYYISDVWQVTLGARYFEQEFSASQQITLPTCGVFCGEGPTGLSQASGSQEFSDTLFKFNSSYDVSDSTKLYVTIAEGFRHGGANGVPVDDLSTAQIEGGVFTEHPDYLFFDPDKSVNYEFGIKGYLTDAIRYSSALFYIDWEDPILLVQTPNGGFPVNYNAETAVSTGIELETNIQVSNSLALNLGYTYTKAELTDDFSIPNIAGGVQSFDVGGQDGDRLPGIPRQSVTASLNLNKPMQFGADLVARLGIAYKGDFTTGFAAPSALAERSFDEVSSSTIIDGYVGLNFDKWQVSLYADNLTNSDDITTSDGDAQYLAGKPGLQYSVNLGDQEYRLRPRTVGVSFSYNF